MPVLQSVERTYGQASGISFHPAAVVGFQYCWRSLRGPGCLRRGMYDHKGPESNLKGEPRTPAQGLSRVIFPKPPHDLRRLRRISPTPIKPAPSRKAVAGSGTGTGGGIKSATCATDLALKTSSKNPSAKKHTLKSFMSSPSVILSLAEPIVVQNPYAGRARNLLARHQAWVTRCREIHSPACCG